MAYGMLLNNYKKEHVDKEESPVVGSNESDEFVVNLHIHSCSNSEESISSLSDDLSEAKKEEESVDQKISKKVHTPL